MGCAPSASSEPPAPEPAPAPAPAPEVASGADVVEVATAGSRSAYTFSVRIRSPDTGCDRYADWWEVLTPEGALLYRRILTHSHVTEQPFTRSGGPVTVAVDQRVVVRAHLHPDGYGGAALAGSVADGFTAITLDDGFAADLATVPPQPDGCLH